MTTLDEVPPAPAIATGAGPVTWRDAMGSLCRISDDPKQATLDLRLAPAPADWSATIRPIWALRQKVYAEMYPEVTGVDNDPYDRYSCVIYTENGAGQVTSTARIGFDGALGVPEAALVGRLLDNYHRAGTQFAELGRFVIDDDARGVLSNYYRAYYELGALFGIDMYLMFVPENKISLYRRLMDAEVVLEFAGLTFGSKYQYVCMEWWLERTLPRFFSWCNARPRNPSEQGAKGADQ